MDIGKMRRSMDMRLWHGCPCRHHTGKGMPMTLDAFTEITYQMCADALLKMWIDNVVTDGEYNRIMDKLNAHWGKDGEGNE